MKIIFICDHGLNLVGGSQESLKIVINAIKKKNDVVLITPGKETYQDEKVKHYHYSIYDSMKKMVWHPVNLLQYVNFLIRTIKIENPDIIHTQEQVGFFIVSFLIRIRLINRNIKVVHTERGLYKKYNRFIRMLFLFSFKYTKALVVTTNYNLQDWNKAIKKYRKNCMLRCTLIENTAGMIFETFDEKLCQCSEDKLTIGFAGRYCDWKGWDLAEKISSSLKNEVAIQIKMVVGCLDEQSLSETRAMFKRMQKKLGERFCGYINFNIEQMNLFYYDIDIFIITSKPNTESFGRVLVEAMSRKTVILGTDCGGAVEVIGNKDQICDEIDDFRDKIIEYEKDRNKLNMEKEEFYKRFQKTYSLENNVRKHQKLYEMLTDR